MGKGKEFPSCLLLQIKEGLAAPLVLWGYGVDCSWQILSGSESSQSGTRQPLTPRTWRNMSWSNSTKLCAPNLKCSPSDSSYFYFLSIQFSRFVLLMIALLSSFGFLPFAFRTGPGHGAKRLSPNFLFHFCILADFSISSQAASISFLYETW